MSILRSAGPVISTRRSRRSAGASATCQGPGAAAESAPHVEGRTDSRGRVAMFGIPPGRYRFGVSVAEPPTAETPYAPTWSGATSGGTVLEISDGQTTRAVLRLPRRMSPRTINGIVTDAGGGTPKGEVLVWLTDRAIPNSRVGSVKATAGQFKFQGLVGRRYTVYGYMLGGQPSALVDVADDPAQTVTIVLPK